MSTGSTADLIRGGISTAAAGGKLDSNTIDSANTSSSMSNHSDESEFVTGAESSQEDLLPGSEDTQKDSEENGQAKPEANLQTSQKEVITVTDEQGRRRKVEIDYSDKKAIKKAFELSAGARKWQAERDQAKQSYQKEQKSLQEMRSNWDAIETAFQKGGVEGLIDLIEGRPGAYKTWEKRAVDRQKFLENASPEEIQTLQAKELAQKSQKELQQIRKENEEFRKKMGEEKETAELRAMEARVHPVFNKYRFADKLGDENDEHMFDEMLWNSAMKRLEPYEEQGVEISNELVEREFRNVAEAIRKRIGLQAEKRATKAIEQKKREATENVQAAVSSGYKTGGAAKEAGDLIRKGNLTELLKGWGKYGSVFQNSKK